MGCSSSQSVQTVPNIPPHHLNKLMALAQISHPLNINRKYEHIIKVDPDKEVGFGFRKTHVYESLLTSTELHDKIKEFWETRTSGTPEVWLTIQRALTLPDTQALEVLEEQKVYMLNGSIQMCLDEKFHKYEVPMFCINVPSGYSFVTKSQKGLTEGFEQDSLDVVVRSVKFPDADIRFTEQNTTLISDIKQNIIKNKKLPNTTKVRLLYQGRELKDRQMLGSYSYVSGMIIQAMIL